MPKNLTGAVIAEMDATQKRPVLLFELGLSSTLRFAAYKTNVVFPTAGNTYGAKTVKIGEAKQTLEGQIGRVTVKFDNVLKDMAGYLAIEDFKGVSLIIKRVYLDALGSATNYNEIFNGYIEEVKGIDRHWLEVKASTGKPLSRKTLGFAYQRMCPWIFGGDECNTDGNADLTNPSLRVSGTADSGTATTLVDSLLSQANDYWNFGRIEITYDGITYHREVADFVAATDTITFDVELPFAVDNTCTYVVYKGCDQVWETCEGTPAYGPSADNSANFGGCIHINDPNIPTFKINSLWDVAFRLYLEQNPVPDNTMSEGVFVARCYGKCRIGGNKIRYSIPTIDQIRIAIGHCRGEVEGIENLYINDRVWADVPGSKSWSEYTGTRTQTADGRFTSRASAYRDIAYSAFTLNPQKKAIGNNPQVSVIMEGLKCMPLAGGAGVYTRNPAVVLYDFYQNVEGYSTGGIDTLSFQSLEELCDAVPSGGTLPRYTFDYNFSSNKTVNDAKKLIWQSFNGRVVMSQGKLKAIWDSAQMADGAGSLTAKTVSHAFTEDNIIKDSISWKQKERPNIVRVHYTDASHDYMNSSVEVKDERDILANGEIIHKEDAYFLTEAEPARRRAKYLFNKFKYESVEVKLRSFSGAGDLEVYDLVTVTHQLPGWTAKQFYVQEKSEDQPGILKFILKEYYSGIYDDSEGGDQAGYGTTLPNPYDDPADSTSITATLVATGDYHNYDAVKVSFTPPADDPFYLKTEIYASNDDSTYYIVGESSGEDFILNGMGSVYQPGETCYIKLVNINEIGVAADMPVTYDASVVISGAIRFGSFYVGPYDMWGGNAAIGNVATEVVIGNLDGTPKIALGPTADAITFAGTQTGFFVDGDGNLRAGGTQSLKWNPSTSRLTIGEWIISPNGIADNFTENDATILIDKTNALMRLGATSGDYITVDGGNQRVRSSNYVSGMAGAGFTLEPDLLEVGNIACRGIFRMAVFQMDVESVVGGNVRVRPGDVLDADMTAADASTLTIEGNETFAVNDILRMKDATNDEWLLVTNIGSAPTYTVTRDQGGSYGAGANPAWKKGAAVVNYGQSGDGGVFITASEANAPYISVFTHAGAPWTTITERLRIGNLNGFLGYSSDIYGFAVGTSTEYIKIDPTNGVQISSSESNALTILYGGDILFQGSTYSIALNSNADGSYLYFAPDVAGTCGLSIGSVAYPFLSSSIFTDSAINLYVDADVDSRTALVLEHVSLGDGAAQASFTLEDQGVTRKLVARHKDTVELYFSPNDDGVWDLGRDAYRWATVYCDDLVVTNENSISSGFQLVSSAHQSNIAVDTDVTVIFGNELWDVGDNVSSNVFTAPVTGMYQFNVHIVFNNVQTDCTTLYLRLVTSNRTIQCIEQPSKDLSASGTKTMQIALMLEMDGSDAAYVQVRQTAGTQNMDITSTYAHFSGFIVSI